MGLMGYYLIAGIMFLVGMIVSNRLKSKFTEYSQIGLRNGLSGREIAEKMLHDNGIYDVRSVSAAAVAAHECGHAVQHATAYSMLQFRSAIVPLVNISSQLSQWVILAGLGLMFGRSNPTILLIGIVLFAVTTLFTLITLPVEYDASNRALAWLENNGMTTAAEHDKAADALKWAARTYLVAAISSVATLLYYILLFLNARDRE